MSTGTRKWWCVFDPRPTFDRVLKLTQTLNWSNIVFFSTSASTWHVHISKASNCSEMKCSPACSSFNYEQNEELLPEFWVCGTATPDSALILLRLLTDCDSGSYSDFGSRSLNWSGAWGRGRSLNRSSIPTPPKSWLLRYLD